MNMYRSNAMNCLGRLLFLCGGTASQCIMRVKIRTRLIILMRIHICKYVITCFDVWFDVFISCVLWDYTSTASIWSKHVDMHAANTSVWICPFLTWAKSPSSIPSSSTQCHRRSASLMWWLPFLRTGTWQNCRAEKGKQPESIYSKVSKSNQRIMSEVIRTFQELWIALDTHHPNYHFAVLFTGHEPNSESNGQNPFKVFSALNPSLPRVNRKISISGSQHFPWFRILILNRFHWKRGARIQEGRIVALAAKSQRNELRCSPWHWTRWCASSIINEVSLGTAPPRGP